MRNLYLLFSIGISIILLVACDSTIETSETENNDIRVKEEVYSREITEGEQGYIQLVLNDDFEILYSKTEAKVNEVQQDYNNIAFAFKKYEEVQPLEDNIHNYTSIHLKYSNILESIDNIKFIPNEIKEKIDELNKIAIEKEEYWALTKEIESEKLAAHFYQIQLEENIEKRTNNPQSVSIGMTKEEVLTEGWGKPLDINITTTAYGVSEQWIYDDYKYLYFEDGILTTIQD